VLSRLLNRLRREESGLALVLALGVLVVLSASAMVAVEMGTSSSRASQLEKSRGNAHALAEAGVNLALARLAGALDPRTGTILSPATTVQLEGGSVTYSGVLGANYTWTITSVGSATNPAGAAPSKETLTRKVMVRGINEGATVAAWSRFYHDNTSDCLTIRDVTIPAPVTSRGDLCVYDGARITGSTSVVSVGDDVFIDGDSKIGTASVPVNRVSVGDRCYTNWTGWSWGTSHKPCQTAGLNVTSSPDRIWTTTSNAMPTDLSKPSIDLNYWYLNAKPGPKYPCNNPGGSFPPGFDSAWDAGDTVPDNSLGSNVEITPQGSSYTCQRLDAQGNIEGEISWNHSTRVLKVKGTIYRDGDLRFDDDGTIVHYQGRAIIYGTDDLEYDEIVCAGGSGNTNCITQGMQNWDPTQNMLIILNGGDSEYDTGATQEEWEPSGLQGIVYARGDCTIHQNFHLSGPVICDEILLPDDETYDDDGDNWPTYYTWPNLGSLVDGQVYATTSSATDFELELGEQG
jgi:hypothetical protein